MHGTGKILHLFLYLIWNPQGCILVFEYCYFLLQKDGVHANNAIDLALQEYQKSGTQATVCGALQHAMNVHGHDCDALLDTIIEIILTNRMCKLILFNVS